MTIEIPKLNEQIVFKKAPSGAPRHIAGMVGTIININIHDKNKPDLSLDDIGVKFGEETWFASLGEYQDNRLTPPRLY